MRYAPDLKTVRASFDSLQTNRPSPEGGDFELLPNGDLRLWCIPFDGNGDWQTQVPQPNCRIFDGRIMLEPKVGRPYQRDYGDGYLGLKVEFDLTIGEDVPAAMRAEGCKLFGMVGYYDMSGSGFPTLPSPSPYGAWAALLWHGPFVAGEAELKVYGYFVSDPRFRDNLANVGMYGGSGDQHGPLPTTAKLKAGQRNRLGLTCVMNSVVDKNLILPAPFGNYAQDKPAIDAAFANANPDGYLGVTVNDDIVGEWDTVAFRGEDRIRNGYVLCNVYHGGRPPESLPSARCHYDMGNLVVTDNLNAVQPQGEVMADITVIVPANTNVVVLNALPVDNGPAVQAKFDAYVAAVRAKAQAAKDADAAKVDGQDVLDIVP